MKEALQKNHTQFLLALIISLGAALRLFHLDYQSLWDDEIATMIQANPALDFSAAWEVYMQNDNMPPLYFIVLRYLMLLFGYKSIVLRAFSAVIGILCIPAIYRLSKKLFDDTVAKGAAWILAINPMLIYYSQEGRPYTLLVLFTILSFSKLIDSIEKPCNRNLLLYTLYTTLLIYAHFFGIFILFAQILYFFFRLFSNASNRVELFKHFWPVPFLIVLLHYPSLPQFLKNSEARTSWITLPGLTPFNDTFHAFLGQAEVPIAMALILLLLFIVQVFSGRLNNANFHLLLFWLFGFLVIPLFRTYTTMPMIVHRYLLPLLPVVIIMMSAAIATIADKTTRFLTIGIFTLFSLGDLIIVTDYYFKITKPDYRGNTELILSQRKTNEPVVAEVGWHYGHFIADVEYMPLGNYMNSIKNKTLPSSFWYCGVRENDLKLNDQEREFLFQNYYTDFWKNGNQTQAIHFKRLPQDGAFIAPHNLSNADFSSGMCVVNAPASVTVALDSGNYNLHFTTLSLPEKPIHDTNARAMVTINGKLAGTFNSTHLYSGYNDLKWAMVSGTNTITIQNTTHGNGKRFLIFKNLVIEKIP
jgi:uncharacterized membrane protein